MGRRCIGSTKAHKGAELARDRSRRDLDRYVILRVVVGSRAYGPDEADSDTDRRGVYLPPAELHRSLAGAPKQVEGAETEECYAGHR